MKSVELSCPNCGATQAAAAPHGTMICDFCGTRYLLKPETHAPQEDAAEEVAQAESDRQWRNLIAVAAILVILIMVLVGIAIAVLGKEDDTPSNQWPSNYHAPRR